MAENSLNLMKDINSQMQVDDRYIYMENPKKSTYQIKKIRTNEQGHMIQIKT